MYLFRYLLTHIQGQGNKIHFYWLLILQSQQTWDQVSCRILSNLCIERTVYRSYKQLHLCKLTEGNGVEQCHWENNLKTMGLHRCKWTFIIGDYVWDGKNPAWFSEPKLSLQSWQIEGGKKPLPHFWRSEQICKERERKKNNKHGTQY